MVLERRRLTTVSATAVLLELQRASAGKSGLLCKTKRRRVDLPGVLLDARRDSGVDNARCAHGGRLPLSKHVTSAAGKELRGDERWVHPAVGHRAHSQSMYRAPRWTPPHPSGVRTHSGGRRRALWVLTAHA